MSPLSQLFSDPLFILRIAMVAILYLVILQVVGVSRREMQRAARGQAVAAPAAQVVGHLIVIDAGSTTLTPGSRLNIEPITTLGRAPTNTIVLESNFVSTEHTRILYRDRSLWVEDMGSRNGTFVEQRQVNQAVAVSPGSVLQVGDVRFKFAV
ncbi:MAG TPA: FHA domain-containing protein [Ktedonobacterales bacterium]|nr:FHA domain-containing protein [Ktedonobacterales bacterium]